VLPGAGAVPETGKVEFFDPQVDAQTGTVLLKARFENRDRRLWPGQFVQAELTLTTLPEALVIPALALQSGQQGDFVYVVTPEATAEPRPVETGPTVDETVVVRAGLAAGEAVVVEGQIRFTAGARVQVVSP